jgi:hypothetical protein
MKKLLLLLSLVVGLTLASYGQPPCKTYSAGVIELCQPVGWKPVEDKARKYPSIRREASPTAQLSFVERTEEGTLGDFAFSGISNVFGSEKELEITEVRLINAGDFVTAAGEKGVRFKFTMKSEGVDARTITFVFNLDAKTKLQVTATSTVADKNFETEVNAAIKSMKFKRQ